MIRVGIAGLGFMGMVHYLTYQKLRNVEVVAICDRKRKRLEGDWCSIRGNFGPHGQRMNLAGVRTYRDWQQLVADNDVDLVDLTLPTNQHADVALAASAHGKHVFCEKPMALELADCRQMLRAAQHAQRQLLVGHVLPFFPEYAWALAIVRSGKYGSLVGGSFRRVIAEPRWLKNYWTHDQVGGPLLDLHVHDAHFIRLLFGMPISVVTRGSSKRGLPKFWHSLFEFSDHNLVVEATSGTIDQQARSLNHGFEIRLQRATLVFEFAVVRGVGQYLCPPTIFDSQGKATKANLSGGDPMDAFEAELREVTRSIASNRTSEFLSGRLACDAIKICQKQSESLSRRRTVRL